MHANSPDVQQNVDLNTKLPVNTLSSGAAAMESTGPMDINAITAVRPLSKYVDRVQGRLVIPWLE